MTTITTNNSIRLKIKKFIWDDRRLRSHKDADNITLIGDVTDGDDLSSSGPINVVSDDELEIFKKYRNNEIRRDRYKNIDGANVCGTNRSKANEIFGELLELDFDTISELDEDYESVIMEFTPFEEMPSRTNSFRQSVKNKLKRFLSNSPTEMLTRLEYEGENYSPVSMKIPVIEDTDQYNRLDTLLFEHPSVEDPRIKFNQYVDVLIYNGNYNNNLDAGNSSDTIGSGRLWRDLSLRKNSIRHPFTTSKSQTVRPILKSKTNENYEYEAMQLKEFDKINFEKFMCNFENYETSKMKQEPHLNGARLNQLKNYYNCNKDWC